MTVSAFLRRPLLGRKSLVGEVESEAPSCGIHSVNPSQRFHIAAQGVRMRSDHRLVTTTTGPTRRNQPLEGATVKGIDDVLC